MKQVLDEANVSECSKEIAPTLLQLAEKLNQTYNFRLPLFLKYIKSHKLLDPHQLDSAIEFIKEKGVDTVIDDEEFEKRVGIGIKITREDIQVAIEKRLNQKLDRLKVERYKFQYIPILNQVKKDFAYLDMKLAKELIVNQISQILGPKTDQENEEDSARKLHDELKNKKKKEGKLAEQDEKNLADLKARIKLYDEEFEAKVKAADLDDDDENTNEKDKLFKIMARDMASALNSEELLRKHKDFTKGRVFTRFPPEPNGYLHIGHAKAMRFSFMSAMRNGGECYLRYDDTNPEKETKEFIDNIEENVRWLGYKPYKVTYASDYFQDLYDLAVELIKRGKAYVCSLSKEEFKQYRDNMKDSPYRNRPVEENLDLFNKMRQGRFSEKDCCLRMKIDMKHKNTAMRDPVAYRIKYQAHPHAGDKWCIYPTYDYTHCINDSLENVTHSLCTLEFEIRRDPYYWLLEALDLYRPFVWEYSRLNITHTVLSKRRLTEMVDTRIVRGWDDPRLFTINGLRRRGYSAEAINHFVDTVGVTRRGNENFVSIQLLENSAKVDLDKHAPRTMAVLEPLLIKIVNLGDDVRKEIQVPFFPKHKEAGTRTIVLTNRIFIDAKDFKQTNDKDFFGLSPDQEVGLKYGGVLKLVNVKTEGQRVIHLECEYHDVEKKTKGRVHWISNEEAVKVECRLYNKLFLSENPMSVKNWLGDLNPESEVIVQNALMHKSIVNSNLKHLDRFQFERLGYFVVDFETRLENGVVVFNRTIPL